MCKCCAFPCSFPAIRSFISIAERVASLVLAIRYFHLGHALPWGVLSLTFVISPIVCSNVVGFLLYDRLCSQTNQSESGLFEHFGVIKTKLAIALGFLPQVEFGRGNEVNGTRCQMLEILFGALPQLFLQIYILGNTGVYDDVFLRSVVIQAAYVIYGLMCGLRYVVSKFDTESQRTCRKRSCSFFLLFTPYAILFLFGCVPLVMFSSVNASHILAPFLIFLVYFFLHFYGSALLLSSIKKKWINLAKIMMGLIFFFVSLSFAGLWLTALAPDLDPDRDGFSNVPAYIWPKPTIFFRLWHVGKNG